MSKLTEQLRTVEVYNEYEFANDGQPYIWRTTKSDWNRASWVVSRRGYHTAKGGDKEFHITSVSNRAHALEEAKEWTAKRYGITEWKRTPFGAWMDAEFVTARVKELKARIKEREAKV